jgi:hypothetical protein
MKDDTMKHMHSLLVSLAMVASSSALAQGGTETDTFNCGQGFIEAGTSAAEVLRMCGEPTTRLAEDQWVYDRGPDQFTTTVYFEADGTVGRIDQAQND